MLKIGTILKIYIIIIASILGLNCLAPIPVQAGINHGLAPVSGNPYRNACGTVSASQTWCVGTDGWTVWSGTDPVSPSGTCSNSSGTYNGTCVAWLDNRTAASFTAHTSTNQLFIDSGTPPIAGQTLVMTGVTAGTTISGASSPFTLSTSPGTLGTIAATSIYGNDTTCASQIKPIGKTSNDWPTLLPATVVPCATPLKAQQLMRNAQPDWLLYRRDTVNTSIGATFTTINGSWAKSGKSDNEPMIVGAYGTGARPLFLRTTSGDANQFVATIGLNGRYMTFVSLHLYDARYDINSPYFTVMQQLTGNFGIINCSTSTFNGTISGKGGTGTGTGAGTSLTITGISGNFHVGDSITGTGVPASTTLTAGPAGGGNGVYTTSNPTTSSGNTITATGSRSDLAINSGTAPTIGDTIVNSSNVTLGVVESGTGPFVLVSSAANQGPISMFGGNPRVICNTSAPPASWVGTGASFRVAATGVPNLNIGSFTSTSVTIDPGFAAPTLAGVAMPFQITLTNGAQTAGMQFVGVTSTTLEDMYFQYSGYSVSQNTTVAPVANFIFRRNMFDHSWYPGGNVNVYMGAQEVGSSFFMEENAVWYGGWDPCCWAGASSTQTHDLYLHDPAAPWEMQNNLLSYSSATAIQWRDGGTLRNNYYYANPSAVNAGMQHNNSQESYDVIEAGTGLYIGFRTAKTAVTSGLTISFDGIVTFGANTSIAVASVENLSNPGSISRTCQISTIPTMDTVTLTGAGCSIAAGVRGDGIQIGDRLALGNGRTIGTTLSRNGFYNNGATGVQGPPLPSTSTVTVSATSPVVVVDPQTRQLDEPFKFVSGTLPTGLNFAQDYCANATSTTYGIYNPTNVSGTLQCLGGTALNATGSGGTALREGTRMFPMFPSAGMLQSSWDTPVPLWITPGMSVTGGGQVTTLFAGSGGITTVQYVTADGKKIVTVGGQIIANGISSGVPSIMVGNPDSPANLATLRVGPNNIFLNAIGRGVNSSGALQFGVKASFFDISSNYFYNWDWVNTANNIQDSSDLGSPAGLYSSTLIKTPQVLNVVNSSAYPTAGAAYYDALRSGVTFTGSITANTLPGAIGGSILNVPSAPTLPNGLTIFEASGGSAVAQYAVIVKNISSTQWLLSSSGTTTSRLLMAGSVDRFLGLAIGQSKSAGWNVSLTTVPLLNRIRTEIKCGDQIEFPGSPACPQQNFLLERDINPASNDNSPVWLEKAA